MKKLLLSLIGILFISCEEKQQIKTYYIEYEVHYPDRVDTLSATQKFWNTPKVESYKGSNKIYYYQENGDFLETIIETSAPVNIITIKEQK